MTPEARKILERLRDWPKDAAYEAEIVWDRTCYLGEDRIAYRHLLELLGLCAVRRTSEEGQDRVQRYELNEIGRALLERPEIEDEINAAVRAGGAWSVKDNKLVAI